MLNISFAFSLDSIGCSTFPVHTYILTPQGYEAQLDALSELISKYKDLKQSEKDAYEYQKSIIDKTKSIASLQKQLAAYGANDTEEARAKIQQIKIDLEEARKDLKETEYDKYLSDTNDMLDDLYDDFESFIDGRLKDTDAILETINSSIMGMSFSIIATLASLNGGVTTDLENLLSGKMSNADYVNSIISKSNEPTSAPASTNTATTTSAALSSEEAKRKAEEAKKKQEADNQRKRNELNAQLASEKKNLSLLENQLTKLKQMYNASLKGIEEENKKRKKNGQPLIGLKDNSYKKDISNLESQIKNTENRIASLNKQLNSLPAYAKGSRHIQKDGLAWTQDGGQEIVYHSSDGALLTHLGKGDAVFTNDMTKRLWEWSQMNPVQFVNGVNLTPALPTFERNINGGDVNITFGDITLPGVSI